MGFKTAAEMKKRFTRPLSDKPIKKSPPKKRGRPRKETVEQELVERDYRPMTEEERKKKLELIDAILDTEKEFPIKEVVTESLLERSENNMTTKPKRGRPATPRSTSSLKGIRETLEDAASIEQLQDIITNMRNAKLARNKKQDDDEVDDQNLAMLLPLLQQSQNQNQDQTGLPSPNPVTPDLNTILLSQLASGKKNAMNPMMLMMMMQMFGNQNQQSTPVNNNNNMLMMMEMFKMVMNQNQKPQTDPILISLVQALVNQNKQPQRNTDIDKLMMKFEQLQQQNNQNQLAMIMSQSDNKFGQAMEMVAGAFQANPKKELLETFNLFKNISGDNRSRSKDEMEYELKRHEIELHEQARRDALDREERKQQREDDKADRLYQSISNVTNQLVGEDGIAGLLGKVAGSKILSKRKDAPLKSPEELIENAEYSIEDLDEL